MNRYYRPLSLLNQRQAALIILINCDAIEALEALAVSDLPIGRDEVNRKKMSAKARRSREAVTRIAGAEHFGRALTLARVAIHTGRTHQIRVHLSAIGHPVVGDPLYGGVHRRVPGDVRAVNRLERPFLHAAKLAFHHPVDGRPMVFTSALPPDLQAVVDALAAHFRPADQA